MASTVIGRLCSAECVVSELSLSLKTRSGEHRYICYLWYIIAGPPSTGSSLRFAVSLPCSAEQDVPRKVGTVTELGGSTAAVSYRLILFVEIPAKTIFPFQIK